MTFDMSLGNLADPIFFTDPPNIQNADPEFLENGLGSMLVIRNVERLIGEWTKDGTAKTPCHLSIGQEAVPVGVSHHLTKTDRVFGAHRSHGHFLALNDDVYGLLAEVLGKADGAAKGMGGSMHLYDAANGFHGSVPIVGATIPLAVGAGLAAQMDGSKDIGVCYFGDGATEEGLFHESLNFAANFKVPVLFVCENNLYSSHLDISERQPASRVARFAEANTIPSMTIDGNDIMAVEQAAGELVKTVRSGQGPAFLEAVTYRWRGHVGPDADVDVGVRRQKEDIIAWRKRDPITRLFTAMERDNLITRSLFDELSKKIQSRVAGDAKKAMDADYPAADQLMDIVYAEKTW